MMQQVYKSNSQLSAKQASAWPYLRLSGSGWLVSQDEAIRVLDRGRGAKKGQEGYTFSCMALRE